MSTQSLDFEEVQRLLSSFATPSALLELTLMLGCLALSWLIVSRLKRFAPERPASVLFGNHVVDGVLFPVLALVAAFAARRTLPLLGIKSAVFKLIIPVLVSLVVIRLTARVLRAAMPESRWVGFLERSVSWLAWGGSILWITGILPAVMEELENISWKMGSTQVTLRAMIEGSLTAVFVMVLALWLSAVIEGRLLRNATTDLSLRKIAVNLTRAVLLFIGLLVALSAAGIDLTALGVLGGALGVGIGFGLQKLAANYVSGFVILAERSLRIGDMVKVDNFEGRISDIKTRYTVIRALNGREAIVPNETLITTRVENSSLADPKVLITTLVQVDYAADLDVVMPALVEAVSGVPRVLQEPVPTVQLSNFAADGLELTVVFWICDPENGQGGVRSEVNLSILRTLRRMGVEIPYPQRVLHQAAGLTSASPPARP
ncbi:mechanosensitive ion channel [Pelomonas sp. APW6]|uniref:Mechanosensitive ion channel n=1 Tax=Roseateles subflavus TaxID=3053353 RepID=A0ABT7LQ65_9BURK|nr:mechanosensitive ion channel domain-containing protein [Pelomonas sp. APW6]MDL5033870.1 mechanosensitive ion channel [Pelomonas sp. APW6]